MFIQIVNDIWVDSMVRMLANLPVTQDQNTGFSERRKRTILIFIVL